MYCIHTKESLERSVKASCNAERIHIRWSKIELDAEFDFSGPNYKASYLSFAYWGSYSDTWDGWTESPSRFEKIVKAISKCRLKDTLKVFNMKSIGITSDAVRKIFSDHGMTTISIIDEDPMPLEE